VAARGTFTAGSEIGATDHGYSEGRGLYDYQQGHGQGTDRFHRRMGNWQPYPRRADEPAFGFSTDVGDVIWCVPTMGCAMPTVPLEVSLHTWAATACHGTGIGLKGAVHAARVLAATGVDILTDADLRQAARADFERRTKGKPYVSPLGPEMEGPLEIPDWVLQEVGG